MNKQELEVHATSLVWLDEALDTLDLVGEQGELTPAKAAQFWAAVAQEAACAAAIMVRAATRD